MTFEEVQQMHQDRRNAEDIALRERLAIVEAERDNARWWSRNRHVLLTEYRDMLKTKNQLIDSLLNNLTDKLAAVEAERDKLLWALHLANNMLEKDERILAALREPSEAVMKVAVLHYSGDLRDAIRAAVAAAEKEVQS